MVLVNCMTIYFMLQYIEHCWAPQSDSQIHSFLSHLSSSRQWQIRAHVQTIGVSTSDVVTQGIMDEYVLVQLKIMLFIRAFIQYNVYNNLSLLLPHQYLHHPLFSQTTSASF